MIHWDWHEFVDQTKETDHDDEYEKYWSSPSEYVVRQVLAGRGDAGLLYDVGFEKIVDPSHVTAFLGETQYKGHPLVIPENGAWTVAFDLADGTNGNKHVELKNARQVRELMNGVACAVYDHYNVTKAGLYIWYAAREELIDFYDRVMGHSRETDYKLKFVPLSDNLKGGLSGRGYAIITKYY